MDGNWQNRGKRCRPRMRVLYVSGYTNDAIAHYGVLDPGLWFLPKPYALSSLIAKVREVLDSAPEPLGRSQLAGFRVLQPNSWFGKAPQHLCRLSPGREQVQAGMRFFGGKTQQISAVQVIGEVVHPRTSNFLRVAKSSYSPPVI